MTYSPLDQKEELGDPEYLRRGMQACLHARATSNLRFHVSTSKAPRIRQVGQSGATKTLAERIRREMKLQALSQKELSVRAGVSQSTVWRILQANASATLDTLEPIASALGISVSDVFVGAAPQSPKTLSRNAVRSEAEKIARLTRAYALCDEESKYLLLELADRLSISRHCIKDDE